MSIIKYDTDISTYLNVKQENTIAAINLYSKKQDYILIDSTKVRKLL